MSRKERQRLEAFSRVKREEITLRKAAELVGVSYRQAKRSYRRFVKAGDRGLVHQLRGRRSNHCHRATDRKRALKLYREKYDDFGPTLAAEYLSDDLGRKLAASTLRRWLLAAGLWEKQRRHAAHRRWRARREHRGELVQMDGSHHDWFEGRRGKAVLMVMIDDATNLTYARFFEGETTAAAMITFQEYVSQYGVPRALYVDHDSIYETTRDATTDEELRETGPLTQFGRAMGELDVELILAHSPQAKGRVERRNGVFQDRLVKAMRLAKVSDLKRANELLERDFLPMLNRRFTVMPARKADVHRRVPKGVRLDRVLAFQERRVVQNDWTIRWRNRWFQLTEKNQRLSLAKQSVTVCEHLDGTIELLFRDRALEWEELGERPSAAPAKRPRAKKGPPRKAWRPAANHPWRRGAIAKRK
jgi:transposase